MKREVKNCIFAEIEMNSLAYALLAMVARKDCSGYELVQLLELFWQAKHSQVYPLLAKLEQKQYVAHRLVKQNGRPDKKIYRLTEQGREILSAWIHEEPAVPVVRDEFLTKIYAIWLTSTKRARELLHERIQYFTDMLTDRLLKIREMEERWSDDLYDPHSPQFGRYMILQRKTRLEQEEINWCHWVLERLKKD
ncbi:transcriptional regulator, PadR family [Seinonella peptonophila]|uniref:Transcriptional regulator, PadR family n=2 Tax=Seinonella peptonophila TaxID=112248 RepID=A0A1M4XLW2_9BACL|nr:transcriptional regulator, PadR family [Seinonella peptonophila]